jgi:hypothetical protein
MQPEELQSSLRETYKVYNEVIKPLIADIEARIEKFPLPLFNELRALNDHIAQCYRDDITDEGIKDEIKKAKRHTSRIILDCYKYLDVSIFLDIEKFERQTKYVDLTAINNGDFFQEYKKFRNGATVAVREAKKVESSNNGLAMEKFQEAYNSYCELEVLILNNMGNVIWARKKYRVKQALKFFAYLLSAIISGIISVILACSILSKFWGGCQ